MDYMNFDVKKLEEMMHEYRDKLEKQIVAKFRAQTHDVFKTNQGEYKIASINKVSLKEMYIEGDKIHNLFSQSGCKISGVILVCAIACPSNSHGGGSASCDFKIEFKPVMVKFNFKKEDFDIDEDIDFNNIQVDQNSALPGY